MEQVEVLDDIIRQLHKIDSKMLSGQFIPAYRDIRRVLAFFEQQKNNLLSGVEAKSVNLKEKEEDDK